LKQGQSEITPRKQSDLERLYRYLFEVHRAITAKHINIQKFLYCDINSGCGENLKVGCKGSPKVFIDSIADYRFPKRAFFIDKEFSHVEILRANLPPADWITVVHADNRISLPAIIRNYSDKWMHGLIYHDPNGIADFELLRAISNMGEAERIDILIRLEATALKRYRTAFPEKDSRNLRDHLKGINKKHWIIQEPQTVHQFSFFLGTNWPNISEMKKAGIYLLDSNIGRSIFDKLNYTKNEIEGQQPRLPYSTYGEYLAHPRFREVRAMAISRANGKCELCGAPINGNTNIHHAAYPTWGTFEKDASNLLAICYPCHCRIHGKES